MAAGTTTIAVSQADLARIRFTRSLLWETVQAVRTLIHPRQQLFHRVWLDTVNHDDACAHLPALLALSPTTGWVPDFLAPPPQTTNHRIDHELDHVASYPLDLVSADLQRSLDSRPTRTRRAVLEPLISQPAAGRRQIVDELDWAWTTLLAPFWAPVDDLISADITYRSARITEAGLGWALSDLHRTITWTDGLLSISHAENIDLDLAGQGLALMPSAFAWPDVLVIRDQPWPRTVVYPARGIGDLWTQPRPGPASLARVIGRTRALLLTDLAQPGTTKALANRHHLSAAAVSAHLGRLRDAGLVTSHRQGKEVRYRRTPLADALLQASIPRQ